MLSLAGHSFSWAVDLRPPSVPHHAGHSNTAACFIKAQKPKRQQSESDSKMEVTVSCNLIIEMASVTFAKYVRSKLWVLPSLRKYQEVGIIGGHLRSLPTTHRKPLGVSELGGNIFSRAHFGFLECWEHAWVFPCWEQGWKQEGQWDFCKGRCQFGLRRSQWRQRHSTKGLC